MINSDGLTSWLLSDYIAPTVEDISIRADVRARQAGRKRKELQKLYK